MISFAHERLFFGIVACVVRVHRDAAARQLRLAANSLIPSIVIDQRESTMTSLYRFDDFLSPRHAHHNDSSRTSRIDLSRAASVSRLALERIIVFFFFFFETTDVIVSALRPDREMYKSAACVCACNILVNVIPGPLSHSEGTGHDSRHCVRT